jgi:nitroimidazol reductase NimA-like FMN-containing flavoprotein (pyridoxamine 5'-phosphate oxidase superfamily)
MDPIPDAVKEFVRAAPVCRIATARANGQPHAIPVCPAYDGEATLYVDLTRNGASAKALQENPRVAVLIDEYYDDWSKLKAVILHCTAEEIEGDELEGAWGLFHEKFPQGAAIGWSARLTTALRIYAWTEWGIVAELPYHPE